MYFTEYKSPWVILKSLQNATFTPLSVGELVYTILLVNFQSHSSSRLNLLLGQITVLFGSSNLTEHTLSSFDTYVSIILAQSQKALGVFSVWINTKSLTLKILCNLFHFVLTVKDGTYSFRKLFQNISNNACVTFHFLLLFNSFSVNIPWQWYKLGLPINRLCHRLLEL